MDRQERAEERNPGGLLPTIIHGSAYRVRKKPIEVVGAEFTDRNAFGMLTWIRSNGGTAEVFLEDDGLPTETERLDILTLEGTMSARYGDWILQGVAGEFYPVRSDIFARTYEVVSAC